MDPFEIPGDIAALDDAALAAKIAEALEYAASFNEIADEDLTDDQLADLSQVAEFVTAARTATAERETAAAERAERVAAARAALKPAEEPVVEDEVVEPAEEVAPEPVLAAATVTPRPARKGVVARAARTAPQIELPDTKTAAALIASADVPGVPAGQRLSGLRGVGDAAVAKMKTFPTTRVGGQRGTQIRGSIASLELGTGRAEKVLMSDYGNDHMAALAAAGNEKRLPGGSLVAAGGWCAPSETLWDLCSIETTEGLLDVASITVDRGGIRYMQRPDWSSIFASEDFGFCLTEQDVIDGELKSCIEVDCPDWTEERLDACGLCIKAGILTNAAFPEYVDQFIEMALIAHQHKMSKKAIDRMLADSTPMNAAGSFPTATDSLAGLELVAQYMRQKYRMSYGETLEIVLPFWYKTIIRADLARRQSRTTLTVTDAEIQGYFAERGLSVQWVYNLYPLEETGGEVCVPATIDVLMYPAGTWVRGETDVIQLDAIYDSTNILSNTYTALFAESGWLMAQRCFESWKVTIGTCATGETGAADLTDCVFDACTS
jgi:hypothetical protein